MEALPKLSPAQALLLRTATRRADGRVIPPETLRGGARVKVLAALLQRGWIEPADDGHVMTDAGYAAIGLQRPAPLDDVQSMDTTDDLQLLEGIPVWPTAFRRKPTAHCPPTSARCWSRPVPSIPRSSQPPGAARRPC